MSTLRKPGETENLRSEISALEQLLEVHESTTIEQSERLEEALRASAARAEELQRREEQQSFLAEAARILSESLDYATTLESLARLAVPRLADWCAIDVVDDGGRIRRVVTAHSDPEKEALARQLEERYPTNPDAEIGAPNVIRTGRPELSPEIPEELLRRTAVDDEHWEILRQLGLRSYMVVPLIARGVKLGAITLVSEEAGVRFDEDDLHVATDLAARAALAVDNARLYRDVESARHETERILESITDAFFALDRKWRFTYLNAEAEALLQRSAEDLLGRDIWSEFPDVTGSRFEEAYRKAVADQRTVEFEEYFPSLATWFEVRAYPSENGLSIYFRNVNERHQAEEALRASEHRFRFLADAIPVQVWTARPDGALDYVSHRAEEYFGRSSEEIVGDGWQRVIREDVMPDVAGRWQHSLETGEPYQVEFPLLSADGTYRWHLARALAQRDDAGRIVRWFGSNTDIHGQKEAEAEREQLITALDIERERLNEIFQEAPAFIATLRGPTHVFETVNPPYLQLIGFRDVVGRPVAQALPEVVEQGFIDLLDRVAATGEAFIGTEVRVLLQTAPGAEPEERFVNFVYQPMRDAAGAVSGIFVHGVDVTDQVLVRREVELKADELSRLARALERSNRELDQFAYVASHDLKAPLRGIANLSQWLEEDLEGELNSEAKEHLDLMRVRVHRMEGLIDGILEYSRAGHVKERPERVDTRALVHEVIDLLAPPESTTIVVDEAMPVLVADRLPLQQVFMNLIGNAIKYTDREDARIEVGVTEREHNFEFRVTDNGPGIAPEYHERIFGIFQTLQARDKVEGTGIGLSLVSKIVQQRGGSVRVESEPGEGSTFLFEWPRES